MTEQARRQCGICKRAPREDDPLGHIIRVTAADFTAAGDKLGPGHSTEPGQYMCCVDCWNVLEPIVRARLFAEDQAKPEDPDHELMAHRRRQFKTPAEMTTQHLM